MLKSLETLADLLKNAVLAELEAQENGTSLTISLDKPVKPSIACSGGQYDNKTA